MIEVFVLYLFFMNNNTQTVEYEKNRGCRCGDL